MVGDMAKSTQQPNHSALNTKNKITKYPNPIP